MNKYDTLIIEAFIYYNVILRNMELVGKVSKGTKMDQIYIPKNRHGLNDGEYVLIKAVQQKEEAKKPYFYNVRELEPLKLKVIDDVFLLVDRNISGYDNIIITGSFLDKGFNFNDLDIIIITDKEINLE